MDRARGVPHTVSMVSGQLGVLGETNWHVTSFSYHSHPNIQEASPDHPNFLPHTHNLVFARASIPSPIPDCLAGVFIVFLPNQGSSCQRMWPLSL